MGTPFSKISIIGIMVIPSFINGQNEISHSGIYYDEKGNLKTKRITASKYLPGEEPHDYHLAMQFVPNIYQYYHQRQALSESQDSSTKTSQDSPVTTSQDSPAETSAVTTARQTDGSDESWTIPPPPFDFKTKPYKNTLKFELPIWNEYNSPDKHDGYFKELKSRLVDAASTQLGLNIALMKTNSFRIHIAEDGGITAISGLNEWGAGDRSDTILRIAFKGSFFFIKISEDGAVKIGEDGEAISAMIKAQVFTLCENLHFN